MITMSTRFSFAIGCILLGALTGCSTGSSKTPARPQATPADTSTTTTSAAVSAATPATPAATPKTPAAPADPSFNPQIVWELYNGTVSAQNVPSGTGTAAAYYFCRFSDAGNSYDLGEFLSTDTLCRSIVAGVEKTSKTFSLLTVPHGSFTDYFTWKTPTPNIPTANSFAAGAKVDGTKLYPCRVLMTDGNMWRIGNYDPSSPASGCEVDVGAVATPSTDFQFAELNSGVTLVQADMIALATNQHIGATTVPSAVAACPLQNGIAAVETGTPAGKYDLKIGAKSTIYLNVTGLCGHTKTIDINVVSTTTLNTVGQGQIAAGTASKLFEFQLEADDYTVVVEPADNAADYFSLEGLVSYTQLP